MTGTRSNSTKDLTLSSPLRTRQNNNNSNSNSKQLASPPYHRQSRSIYSNNHNQHLDFNQYQNNPLLLSPTLSSLSTLSSSTTTSPDLTSTFSISPIISTNSSNKFHYQVPPSPVSVSRDFLDMSTYSKSLNTSPTLNATLKGKGKAGIEVIVPQKGRQTKLQEHLRSGKPSSSNSNNSLSKSNSSSSITSKTGAKRGRKPSIKNQLIQDELLSSSIKVTTDNDNKTKSISDLSDEQAEVRLGQEKDELMNRLADYG